MTRAFLILTAITVLAVPVSLTAEGSPGGLYTAALARERGLREPGVSPSLNELRGAIAAYESIVRRYPDTSYTDHALWQAAGLAVEAYDRFRERLDLETGLRLLTRLEAGHADSPFASRASERRGQLQALTRLGLLTAIDRDVRPSVVRVTLALSQEVAFHSERLQNPDRLFFDFPGTEAALALRDATLTFDRASSAITAIRLGRHPGDTTRVVVDTADVHACRVLTLYEPYRVVIDCDRSSMENPAAEKAVSSWLRESVAVPVAAEETLEARPSPLVVGRVSDVHSSPLSAPVAHMLKRVMDPRPAPPVPPRIRTPVRTPRPPVTEAPEPGPGELSVARQLGLQVSRIVIDPGHGGHDPGARSRGLQEADLVLDIAERLEQLLLTQPGVEVVMTRRGNSYLPLEARTTMANRVEADLFLSIHANASQNSAARGIETYFLNFAPDRHAERIAARENVSGSGTMNDLGTLLQTIAGNSKIDESRAFAGWVQGSLAARLHRVDPKIPDLGVKQAPFLVLIGARMPSVLAEVSFVTNRDDATLLSTDNFRAEIAQGLFEGILRYQRSLDPEVRVAERN